MRLLLSLGLSLFSVSCKTVPLKIPYSEETSWVIDADLERETGGPLHRGQPRSEVITRMGQPRHTRTDAIQPNVELLVYFRVVPGPMRQKQILTDTGWTTYMLPVYYQDRVEVYLEDGVVAVVKLTRKTDHGELDTTR